MTETEMTQMASTFADIVFSGELESTLGAPIFTLTLVQPEFVPNTPTSEVIPENVTFSPTPSPGSDPGNVMFLVSRSPTGQPTGQQKQKKFGKAEAPSNEGGLR